MQHTILRKVKSFLFCFLFFYGAASSCFAQESIFTMTFGEGASPSSRKPLDPADGTTTLSYVPAGTTSNGTYTLLPNPYYFNVGGYHSGQDHTTGDTNGYMMLLDTHILGTSIYKKTIDGLCPDTKYKFSAWISNVEKTNAYISRATFIIRNSSDNLVIATNTSRAIPIAPTLIWEEVSINFTIPPSVSSIILEIVSGSTTPNHTAYDDITFEALIPDIQFTNLNPTVCMGENVPMGCIVQPGFYTNPVYQWQKKNNITAVWENISGATNNQYTAIGITETTSYRMLTSESGNIENHKCRTASVVNTINVRNIGRYTFSGTRCSPTLILSGSETGVSYQLVNEFNNPINDPVIGTGSPLSFTVNISGKYKVRASNPHCQVLMNGEAEVMEMGREVSILPDSFIPPSCINIALPAITHTATEASGIDFASITGLPTGVTAIWTTNKVTISGTPTVAGVFNYTIPLTWGCNVLNAIGTITVVQDNTVTAGITSIVCVNTILPNITHTVAGATSIGTATGLPAGVSAAWTTNKITISGTPTLSGTFNYSIPLSGGCGSAAATGTITVTPKPVDIVNNQNICFGESYTWDVTDTTYSASGTYAQNNDGCTADQVLNLTVGTKPTTVVTNENICFGESYTWDVTGITYTTAGTYTQNNNGCTADQVLNLTIGTKPTTVVTNENICFGESYTWDVTGITYTTAGAYTQNNNGCTADQVLNLTIGTKPTTVVTNENICFGESYTWDVTGITYTTAGTYTQTNNGCTADQVLNLTIGTKPTTVVTNQNICFGESYTWGVTGITYTTAGTYTQNNNGCTADQVLNLTIGTKPTTVVTNENICFGESYTWDVTGITYTTAGTYTQNNNGCTADQVLNLTVGIKPSDIVTTKSICAGESYKWIDNITYTISQTGLRISNDGCTADQVLNLTVALPLSSSIVANSVLPEYCFEDNTGAFSIEISGGIAPYRVSLNNSNGIYEEVTGTEHSFSNISGSRQIVYIKDALDCTFDLPVIMPEAIVLNPVATVNYGCSVNSVTIAIDPSTNFLDVDYALDNGNYQTDNLFTNLSAGLHTITARHTNGCIQSTKAFIIKHVEPLKLSLTDGEMNEIVANATGGAGEYQYSFEGQSYNNENKFIIYKSGDYNVTVIDKNGCSTTVTQYFAYIDVCIPNYFTPNGDGVNDEWGPDCTVNYRSLTYTIIDRYGREIANYHYGQKWDGKYNGKELASGDYWYVLKLNDPNDRREFVGHFTLYR